MRPVMISWSITGRSIPGQLQGAPGDQGVVPCLGNNRSFHVLTGDTSRPAYKGRRIKSCVIPLSDQ